LKAWTTKVRTKKARMTATQIDSNISRTDERGEKWSRESFFPGLSEE
jgi:hypothetical protein